jgi:hypothetical protein
MMGALVEVDNVGTSGEYLRGRVVDPTGAFNVYAGQYQPEALISLSNLTIPCFIAVVGKTNAYKPDEETTIVSIRPETIVEIDAKTRDCWVIETAAKTLERVERSQLPEAEKVRYRQMCKDSLTKLVYMPQETSVLLNETPEVLTPHQKENNPTNPTIEPPTIKDKDNQPDDNELKIGFLHPILNEEKPPDTLPASASEKHIELESKISMDALLIRDQEVEESPDKTLIASQASSPEELPKPENESSKTHHVQESKESRTKRNNPVKRQTKKKKIDREFVNNNQKTLFTEAPSQK